MAEPLPEKFCRITGIGQSEVGRPSAKSPLELTIEHRETEKLIKASGVPE